MESILDIQESIHVDESILSYEDYEFQPISGTQLNSPGEITIRIENQDCFFHPRRSWLQIEGTLKKTNDVAYAVNDLVSLVNNGIMYLFDNIKYNLSGQEVESIFHPGPATTMLGLAKYSINFNAGPGLIQGWLPDDGDGTAVLEANSGFKTRHGYFLGATPIGSFRICIDLEHIFGFCEDYDKLIYGFTHTLTLVRAGTSNDALFRTAGLADGKIILDKLSWFMPRVVPNDVQKFELYKTIQEQVTLDVGFRMRQCSTITVPEQKYFTWRLGVRSSPEKPRYIILGLQTDKKSKQEKNSAIFDHCGLQNAYVSLNNVRYPAIDFHADFEKNRYENLYKSFIDFNRKFYGVDWLVSSTGVDAISYKKLHPIFIFDVTKQSERLKLGVVDITIEMFFGANVVKNTIAFALLLSDRKLKFKSDGKKMSIIY